MSCLVLITDRLFTRGKELEKESDHNTALLFIQQ